MTPKTADPQPMTHREILEALTGLLLAMFVAMLSSTVVANALPAMVTDLDGSQTGYAWIVVATLLTTTASTPIWGKLADLLSKKLLVQSALVIYTVGSLAAAFAPNMELLIGARAFQGIGVGGLTALVQVIIATMVSPRERGRYSGYVGGTFAIATVSGPLLGGLVVDSPFGWRGCFFLGLPVAALAFVVVQKTLHLPVIKRPVKIDYAGATLIVAGISVLLAWISLAGQSFAWTSGTSAALVAAGIGIVLAAIWVEAKVATEPVIPLRLFRDPTISLAIVASVMGGVVMFASTVYLSQYFQLSLGMSPTEAGLMSVPQVVGLLVSTTIGGRMITRTGVWKPWLIGGMVLVLVGTALVGTIDEHTSLWVTGGYTVLMGLGLGSTLQNLVLAVQNSVEPADLGSASAVVVMFRTIGGSAGISALGAVLAHQVAGGVKDRLTRLVEEGRVPPEQLDDLGHSHGEIPDLGSLPLPVREAYEAAFGNAVGDLFLVCVPAAVLALVCALLIRNVPLRTTTGPPVEVDAETATETEAGVR
jgi:EmrB/QacA subfamily drug resistance transporter